MNTHSCRKYLLIGVGAAVVVLSALQASVAGDPAASTFIAIDNFRFKPATNIVAIGTTVTWINRDDVPHTVVSADKKSFESKALDTDERFSFTFTAKGTNNYFCSVHPHMIGCVIVQ